MWTQQQGIALCRLIESFAPQFGLHVALTGGLLYRDGPRKDCDIIIYRIRQCKEVDWVGFGVECDKIGLSLGNDYGFCQKAFLYDEGRSGRGKEVDLLFPEEDGEYGAYGDFEPVTPIAEG